MNINLYGHQLDAVQKLESGSILCGGVGSGKSRVAIHYYFTNICLGSIRVNGDGLFEEPKRPRDLYIITTARKRDTFEWEGECANYLLSKDPKNSIAGIRVIIDSWNNIGKYINVKNAFFIFDEQRLVGSGSWVKNFIKISKLNKWILLSATPGDSWIDYAPVFIANGFYKNRTDFIRNHVIYRPKVKYPVIDRYVEMGTLAKHLKHILVLMPFQKPTVPHTVTLKPKHNEALTALTLKKRWNPYTEKPAKDINEVCYTLRRITNSDKDRVKLVYDVYKKHNRLILFYNFNYELDLLRQFCKDKDIFFSEWNGQKHEPLPTGDEWIYLVQYTAGAEGWNCIETNTVVFYSTNYSYKIVEQAAGRIDRLNTSYRNLYYYHLVSDSEIDKAIQNALRKKRTFQESKWKAIKT